MIRLRRLFTKEKTNERGFVTLEFVAGVGFILLPTMLLVTVLPTWFERVSMARVASREAARVFVLSQDQAQASAAVDLLETNNKLPAETMDVTLTGDPKQRGGQVTATVTTKLPITSLPLLNLDAGVVTITETHTEVVDQFRSFAP